MYAIASRSRNSKRSETRTRRGAMAVLATLILVVMMIFVAFAIDLGYLLVERGQLQRTADAAALAAGWELADEGQFKGDPYLTEAIANARITAQRFAGWNSVGSINPVVDLNTANHTSGDVVIGYMQDPYDPSGTLDTSDPRKFNTVRVVVHRDGVRNGQVPSFFARVMGVTGFDAQATATAAISSNISGFRIPPDGSNLPILPFALDEETWNNLQAGIGTDSWGYNEEGEYVSGVGDGIPECDLYPGDNDPAGNRGTVDVGGSNNSTADIARQILDGASPADLEHHGGELKLDANGQLQLQGDTGVSAGFKEELAAVIGEPRIIPIFREVQNPGDNAVYTIVKFVGIRIMHVELNGRKNDKGVIIQPCAVVTKGAIYGEIEGGSSTVFTPVTLVR